MQNEKYYNFYIIIRHPPVMKFVKAYPLSFRTVESIDYKKAMLIFYEQNNLYAFKQIFMQQFEFAVQEYF